jgi:putative N6-adenine-specific DNA methylase
MNREFTAEQWKHLIPSKLWYQCVEDANDRIRKDLTQNDVDIQGYDIDPEMIKIAKQNAADAGVEHLIHFQTRDVANLSHSKKYGFLITNPPYGERLEEKKDLPALYRTVGERYKALDSWSMYLITSYENAEKDIGRKADKKRKIYNGMMKTYFLQFNGPKPPKRKPADKSESQE